MSRLLWDGDVIDICDGELIEGTSDLERRHYIASMQWLLRLPARAIHGGHFQSYSGERHRGIIRDRLRQKGH